MHTLAPSPCVFHRTDGRRIGRVNRNQFDTSPEALRFEQLQVFSVEQPREHASFHRAKLRHRFLFRRGGEILGDERFELFLAHTTIFDSA